MSKKTAAAPEPQASLNIAATGAADQAEADRIAAEKAEADRIAAEKAEADRIAADQAEADRIAADQAEADRIAAEKAATLCAGVLLRSEYIQGVWYPHGVALTCSNELARALEQDGALDLHPAALEHALANGAKQFVHQAPEPAAD